VERDASLLLAEAQQQRTHQEGLRGRWQQRRPTKWSTRKAVGVEQVEMGVAVAGSAETSAVDTSVHNSVDSSSRRNFLHFDSPPKKNWRPDEHKNLHLPHGERWGLELGPLQWLPVLSPHHDLADLHPLLASSTILPVPPP